MRKIYRVEYVDEAFTPYFTVHTDTNVLWFTESSNGLYYYETATKKKEPIEHALVSIVDKLREAFRNREYRATKLAWQIQGTARCQSLSFFLHAVGDNVFRDLPITRRT